MPYGSYTICAQDKAVSPTKRFTAAAPVTNSVRNPTATALAVIKLPAGTTTPNAVGP